jgi:radical SAM superfamily enzyme YgiQ (UPF0313 family)
MKILLVYPSTLSAGKVVKFRKAFLPPLNLAILDRLTEQVNPRHDVNIINDCVETIDFNTPCDLVGITAITSQAIRAYQIADRFRSQGVTVVLGGVHPSQLPQEAVKHADAVVVGEAEEIWPEVLSDFEAGRLKALYTSHERPDLTNLVIPKWDNFNLSIYRRAIGYRMPRMPLFTTRGCVHNCKYCSVSKFFGRKYRHKPVENVLNEIDATNAESIFFSDDNIICNTDHTENLFTALKARKKKVRWMSQASTKILDQPQLIEMAADAGCKSMIFGIESINQKNLADIKKRFNHPEQYIELYNRCIRAGIKPWYSMIFGLDHDTLDTMEETAQYLKKNRIWNVLFWILTPLPGTDLYQEMSSDNRIISADWSKYDCSNVVFKPSQISPENLNSNFWNIYQSFYTVPIMFQRVLDIYRHSKSPLKSVIQNIFYQMYFRKQISGSHSPYSMGISRIS